MRDLLTLILAERNTILRGLAISFVLIFPFTFIPAISRNGLSWETLAERFSTSLLYTFGFSVVVGMAAVMQNYKELADCYQYFDKPAFRSLNFNKRMKGAGSIVQNLAPVLLGQSEGYFFLLQLSETDKKKPKVNIVPWIELSGKSQEIKTLTANYGFKKDKFLGKTVPLNKIDLEDEESIRLLLKEYAAELKQFHFKPLEFNKTEVKKRKHNNGYQLLGRHWFPKDLKS